MTESTTASVLSVSDIKGKIHIIGGVKVMFDFDLAELYGISTSRLNQAVKRNAKRFPNDFVFSVNVKDLNLISQNVISSYGGKRKPSYVFTEQGVAMLSSVLKSDTAIQINIQIIRIFTKLREMVDSYREIREKVEKLEAKYDEHFKIVFQAIRNMIKEEEKPREGVGFKPRD